METQDERVFRYEISEQGTLISANSEWFDFAAENGATEMVPDSVLGRPVWESIAGNEVRHLYRVMLDRLKETESTLDMPYRCDSPEYRRLMNMRVFHIPERQVFCFESRILTMERRQPVILLESNQGHGDALLSMCSWCKKILSDSSDWLEPELAIQRLKLFESSTFPRISHGVCSDCKTQLYKELSSL